MGVPAEAPSEIHVYWANIPNCAEINFLFELPLLCTIVRVKCDGWGQLANDEAATRQAFYHIKNKKNMWRCKYIGWEEIGGNRKGTAPIDFEDQYNRYWEMIRR